MRSLHGRMALRTSEVSSRTIGGHVSGQRQSWRRVARPNVPWRKRCTTPAQRQKAHSIFTLVPQHAGDAGALFKQVEPVKTEKLQEPPQQMHDQNVEMQSPAAVMREQQLADEGNSVKTETVFFFAQTAGKIPKPHNNGDDTPKPDQQDCSSYSGTQSESVGATKRMYHEGIASTQQHAPAEESKFFQGSENGDQKDREWVIVRETDHFVTGLGIVLTRMASMSNNPQRPTIFHSQVAPRMSISNYLTRIHKYFGCSDECFVMALIYIDRLVKLHPAITVSTLSCHRLLITAVMLAAKFHDDLYYSNAHYAKVGGISLNEMGTLEHRFLNLLCWKLYVPPEEYESYRGLVCNALP